MKVQLRFLIILLFCFSLPAQAASPGKPAVGVTFNFSEAWFPNHYRLRLNSYDLGYEWRSDMHYGGVRLWRQGYYAGTGITARLSGSGGVYAMFGREWVFSSVFALSAEGFAVAGSKGMVMGLGTFGVSLVW